MSPEREIDQLIGAVDTAISKLTEYRMQEPGGSLDEFDSIETDSFGQLVDKLLVVHIRYWNLENEMTETLDSEELAAKRRASEPLFKVFRPMLVKALDKKNVNTIKAQLSGEADVLQLPKSYRGWKSRDI